MSTTFELDARLDADTLPVCDLPLTRVLLMNDARYPWLILVPRRNGLRELHELAPTDRRQLNDEIDACSRALAERTGADKMNVAALGNQVPMLHVHVIARFRNDDAWPNTVWGVLPPLPYPDGAESLRAELKAALDA
jgi:diadenosine tetraphosphate (Ap4A) HIT family hydrolase